MRNIMPSGMYAGKFEAAGAKARSAVGVPEAPKSKLMKLFCRKRKKEDW